MLSDVALRVGDTERLEIARAFGEAWDRADLDALMSFVTEDCVYSASVGPEPGETFVGREAVRLGFARLLAFDSGLVSESGEAYAAAGDRVVAHWSYRGAEHVVRGIDVFRFRGPLICEKDAFRKL